MIVKLYGAKLLELFKCAVYVNMVDMLLYGIIENKSCSHYAFLIILQLPAIA